MTEPDCMHIVCIVRIFVRQQQKICKAFSPPFLKVDLKICYTNYKKKIHGYLHFIICNFTFNTVFPCSLWSQSGDVFLGHGPPVENHWFKL